MARHTPPAARALQRRIEEHFREIETLRRRQHAAWTPARVQTALATLRRVPDEIILAVAGRDFHMADNHRCVVGWVVREKLALFANRERATAGVPLLDASETEANPLPADAQAMYGGSIEEWQQIFHGVTRAGEIDLTDVNPETVRELRLPDIELAFVRRVDEAVCRLSVP